MIAGPEIAWPPPAPELPHAPLSALEARRVLARAMIAVGRATSPHATFVAHQAAIMTAMTALGRRFDAHGFLESCGVVADTPRSGVSSLPTAAAQQLHAVLAARHPDALDIRIGAALGGDTEGYEITYRLDGDGPRAAFALPYGSGWVFAPGPIGSEDCDDVTAAFRRHHNLLVALGARIGDAMSDATRETLAPVRTLWPGERDPRGLCDQYPLVFVMAPGTSAVLYCGYDPVTRETEPYDHR